MIADGLPHKEKKGAQCRGVETSNGPESPAIAVIERLQETCPGRLLVVEPHVDDLPPGLAAGGRTELVSLDQALAADVILLLVFTQQDNLNSSAHSSQPLAMSSESLSPSASAPT
jgi:UDP-N-acetyl-D-mannosaminuronate dehydrogenase